MNRFIRIRFTYYNIDNIVKFHRDQDTIYITTTTSTDMYGCGTNTIASEEEDRIVKELNGVTR